LWDYDLPAAPTLLDITVNGRPIKAVAQVTKQGFIFTFDRVTGKPIWPIEERPVPHRTCRVSEPRRRSRFQPGRRRSSIKASRGAMFTDTLDFAREFSPFKAARGDR
jgi:quinoprotein glucose dehydrogenase